MEIMHKPFKYKGRAFWFSALLLFGTCLHISAQPNKKEYSIKDGKMHITLSKHLTPAELNDFISRFELADLDLKTFIKTANADSLKKLGWAVVSNTANLFIINKPLFASEDLNGIDKKVIWSADVLANLSARFPAVNNKILYGYNRFRNKNSFAIKEEAVTFFIRKHTEAREMKLAGSFTDWEHKALRMTKTDSGWIAQVILKPGKYWYKAIADGRWMTDDDNLLRENDGEGNVNSVYFRPNVNIIFRSDVKAKKVFVAGSFNNWDSKQLAMNKTAEGWSMPLYLANGTHTYKFVADGKWYYDATADKLPDGKGEFNSVIRIGKPYVFKLKGFADAKKVELAGSFNNWKPNELFFSKTSAGWELPYTLGQGNYDYKFIVDGQWITDPANTLTVNNGNSYLIISPNYTFRLKGFATAKTVHLAGDFNDWNPNAYPMQKVDDEWVFSVHLTRGKHLYKFIVDGKWIIDPANKLWEQNEHNSGNSILWISE